MFTTTFIFKEETYSFIYVVNKYKLSFNDVSKLFVAEYIKAFQSRFFFFPLGKI